MRDPYLDQAMGGKQMSGGGSYLSGIGGAIGGVLGGPVGGMLGSSALGAIGSAFGGEEDELSSEEKALLKSQTRGQEIENYQQQAGSGPASILQERMKMDQLLAQYGPAATPLRIANMAMTAAMLGTGEMYNLGETARTMDYLKNETIPNVKKNMGQNQNYRQKAIEEMKKKFGSVMGASPNYGQLLGGGR